MIEVLAMKNKLELKKLALNLRFEKIFFVSLFQKKVGPFNVPIPCWGEIGMGFFPMNHERDIGKFLFTMTAKPWMGKIWCALMNGEIYLSLFLLNMGFSFSCRERKLHHYEMKIVAELNNVFKYLEWWIGNIFSHNFLKWLDLHSKSVGLSKLILANWNEFICSTFIFAAKFFK